MSTDTPLPTAPELPTTSHSTAEGDAWNAAFSEDNKTDSTISATNSEAPLITDKMTTTTTPISTSTTVSSTAYSFAGSALGSESININNKENIEANNSKTAAGGDKEDDKNEDSMFECNICLDTAKDAVVSMCGHLFCWPCLHQWLETRPNRKLCPVVICLDTAKDAVVSMCGHLFCWPCLHQWLETRPNRKLCPVCKAAIGKDKSEIYRLPPRPAGQRTEPEPQQGFQGFSFGDGFHMSFGIGLFLL
ncbi:hypothetical protein DOY81_008966, partial [Sarcophaga bullata]